MNSRDITRAIKSRIETLGETVVYPNVHPEGILERPYLVVQFASASRTDTTLKATQTQEQGTFMVGVIVDPGTGVAVAEELADRVSELFPAALRIPFTGGKITITKPADIKPGIDGESEYRVPVMIEYHATH